MSDGVITVDEARAAWACAGGLRWLRQHPGATVLDIPRSDWRAWVIHEMPSHAAPYLATLSRDDEWFVRRAVAEHPDAGPLLRQLSEDPDEWVREAAASRRLRKAGKEATP